MKGISLFATFFAFWIAFASAGLETGLTRENLRKLARANNEFAFNLQQRLPKPSQYSLFSPIGLSTVFGMLLYGARGETAKELRDALGYEHVGLSDDLVHETFNHYLSGYLQGVNYSDGYILKSVSTILIDKRHQLLDDYRRKVEELYKAPVRSVDFLHESSEIVKEINGWVTGRTNGTIETPLDDIGPETDIILLNAAYFKGIWKTRFEPYYTTKKSFHNSGCKHRDKVVPMMYMQSEFPYAVFNDFQALELPFKGEKVSMLILLPREQDGFINLEKRLRLNTLLEILNRMSPKNVEIFLPKFKLEFEKELRKDLLNVGVEDIFFPGANLSGMTPKGNVTVSKVITKAVIEVNEEGSERAQGREIFINKMIITKQFKADHPFLFAIIEKDSKSNMITFLGRVNCL